MRSLLAALCCLAALACPAQERKYAVLSLMSDQILIVHYVAMIGGRIDRNIRDYLQLEDPVLDKTALLAANEALKRADASAKPVLLIGRDRALYAQQAQLLDQGASTSKLLENIRPLLKGSNATHLILLTKDRGEARVKFDNGAVGSGMVEGVGYYLDPNMGMRNLGSGDSALGLVAPFAYFRAALIDLASGAVVKEEVVNESYPLGTPAWKTGETWSSISAAEKMRNLQQLVREEVAKVVPKVAGAPQ